MIQTLGWMIGAAFMVWVVVLIVKAGPLDDDDEGPFP